MAPASVAEAPVSRKYIPKVLSFFLLYYLNYSSLYIAKTGARDTTPHCRIRQLATGSVRPSIGLIWRGSTA